MPKLFENQTSVVLWGARGIGRAVSLALVRSGSQLALADPSKQETEKLRELLLSKDADVFAAPWGASTSDGAASYQEAMSVVMDRIRGGHQFVHRLVLAVGVDERFWESESAGASPSPELIVGRLEAMLHGTVEIVSKQDRPGRIVALWPWVDSGVFDKELQNAVEAGLASLRAISRQIAPRGVGLTIIRLGPTETGMGGTGSPAALKTGEIGDAVVAIASLPKRVWMEEITLAALDNKVE